MTSSTRSCDPHAPLVGCGVDCEAIARFAPMLEGEEHPMPLVFTRAEVDRARSLPFPARALCSCFCAKEAAFKALNAPINFTDCELFLDTDDAAELRLSPLLSAEHGIGSSTAEIRDVKEAEGVVMVVVVLFGAST
jgi:phosphopantetheine--protein transferase-like protein